VNRGGTEGFEKLCRTLGAMLWLTAAACAGSEDADDLYVRVFFVRAAEIGCSKRKDLHRAEGKNGRLRS